MKFSKRYREHMKVWEKELPVVDLKSLKKMLKRCRKTREGQSKGTQLGFEDGRVESNGGGAVDGRVGYANGCSESSDRCPDCEDTFIPLLLKETRKVAGCFNTRARRLLQTLVASGFRKYMFWAKDKLHYSTQGSLLQQGQYLVDYGIMNSIAVGKLLKKYDKVHCLKRAQAFHGQARSRSTEILQSPWLCELMAFYINMQKHNKDLMVIPGLLEGCSLILDDDGKPSLSCSIDINPSKLSIDLTCSICLDPLFDAVSLSCGHMLCYMCACGAASVSIVDGLKSANPKSRCPLCRQAGVYAGSVHLNELNIILSRSCREYWKERLQRERLERVQKAKEHWQSQCQAFMGF